MRRWRRCRLRCARRSGGGGLRCAVALPQLPLLPVCADGAAAASAAPGIAAEAGSTVARNVAPPQLPLLTLID